jgi:hypothetical protein
MVINQRESPDVCNSYDAIRIRAAQAVFLGVAPPNHISSEFVKVDRQLVPVGNTGWNWTVAGSLSFGFTPYARQLLLQIADIPTVPLAHHSTRCRFDFVRHDASVLLSSCPSGNCRVAASATSSSAIG